jgi:hypothetical protein
LIPRSNCQLADFTFSLSGMVGVPPIVLRNSAASGTHTLSLNALAVSGVYLKLAVMVLGPGH